MNKYAVPLIINAIFVVLLASCAPDTGPEKAVVAEPEPQAPVQSENDLAEQVARMGAIGFSYDGVFSPGGDRIAFVTNASGVPNVWMVDADGGEMRMITAGGQVNNWLTEWSDDGRYLGYSSSAASETGAGRDGAELAGIDKLAQERLLLNWNAAGRSELAYFDLATGEMTPG